MTLNILGARVKVVDVDLDDEDWHGKAVFDKNEILIDRKLKGRKRDQVLLHEVTHWALYRSGLREGMDKLLEEAICDVISFVFTENNFKEKK